jgi:hypothetical protein
MTDIVYLPVIDLQGTTARIIRAALMECAELIVPMSGFSTDLTNKQDMSFPEVGVDWRSVVVTGHTGNYTPQVFTPEGLAANIHFASQQTGMINIGSYSRFSSYPVAVVEDLTFDLFTYFGDPKATSKVVRHIPLIVPIMNPNFQLTRYGANSEVAGISGNLCVYGGTSQGGITTVKLETAKVYRFMRTYRWLFSQMGLTQLQVDLPTFSTYQSTLYEGSIPFSCTVNIERPSEMAITPPGIPVPPMPDTSTIIDAGWF